MTTLLAALIAIVATAGTARIALTDMRPDLRILHDVGAPHRTGRRITLTTTLTVGVLGTLVGTLAGIVLGVTVAWSIASSDTIDKGTWALTLPWIPILLCIRVDLPDPLFPTIAIDSPAYTDSETPANASKRALPLP